MGQIEPTAENLGEHVHLVRGIARSLTMREGDAEDLAQDALVEGLAATATEERRWTSWWRTVCRRLLIQRWRADTRRERRERLTAEKESLPSTADIVERRAALRAVTEALCELPPHEFEAIRLRYYEDIGPTEIAARTSQPLSTVKRRLERGMNRLRASLRRTFGDDHRASCAILALVNHTRPSAARPWIRVAAVAVTPPLILVSIVAVVTVVAVLSFVWREADDIVISTSTPVRTASVVSEASDSQEEEIAVRELIEGDSGPKSRAESGRGGAQVSVRWSDGSIARNLPAIVFFGPRQEDGIGPQLSHDPDLSVRTNDNGNIELDNLPVGAVGVYVQPSGSAWGDVFEGGTVQLDIEIPEGLTVEGQVVNRSGQPVFGAEIWTGFTMDHGGFVTKTDEAGRFHLRSIVRGSYLGAGSSKYASSPVKFVWGEPGEPQWIDLELGEAGSTVAGSVLSRVGEPVPQAVLVFSPQKRLTITTFCDEQGKFTVDGLGEGDVPYRLTARGHAPCEGTVTVVRGSPAALDLVLDEPAVLEGRVVDEDGQPVSGCYVSVIQDPRRKIHRRTDQDGFYRLTDLPSGEVVATAAMKNRGRFKQSVRLTAGEITIWNPTLENGVVISGRVENGLGEPVRHSDVFIQVGSGRGGDPRSYRGNDRTDDDGRFRFLNCPDDSTAVYRVLVYEPNREEDDVPVYLDGVRAGDRDVLVVMNDATRPSAHVKAKISDGDGRPMSTRVLFRGGPTEEFSRIGNDPMTGYFQFGPVHPGKYDIQFKSEPLAIFGKKSFELAAGQTLDLGTMSPPETGSLRLEVDRSGGDGHVEIRIRASMARWDIFGMLTLSADRFPEELELGPGRYSVEARGTQFRTSQKSFEIEPGQTTDVLLTLNPK